MSSELISLSPLVAVLAMLGFMAFFATMWVVVGALLAQIGGWSTLAARFPASRPAEGIRKSLFSADLRRSWSPLPVTYSGCLNMTVGTEGFMLVPMLLFRAFHPPLWVPWQDVASVTEVRAMLLFPGARIEFRNASPILRVWGSAGRALRDSCPRAILVRT